MGTVLVITAAQEGGLYSPSKDCWAPIRIYSDRRVKDDIAWAITGKRWRTRLSRSEFRHARKAAQRNRDEGLV